MESIWTDIFGSEGIGHFLITGFQFTDALDILAVAFLLYQLMLWIRKTRGWMLFKGIGFVLVVWAVASALHLNMVVWIFERAFSVGILAIIIIFQPEIRRALEKLGTGSLWNNLVGFNSNAVNDKTVESLCDSMTAMAAVKTGALIAVEQQVALGEYEQTGIPVDAEISSQLLINIFEKNTPLHDGAVIIRGNRVLAATCYLPLSDNSEISKELGTRHRAALGLSEVSDAKVFIVSEETGAISMASGGKIYRDIDAKFVRNELMGNADGQTTRKELLLKRLLKNGKR